MPSLDFAAPKYVIDGKPDYISVVFSFACILSSSYRRKSSCLWWWHNKYTQSIQYLQKLDCEEIKSIEPALKKCLVKIDEERPNIQQGNLKI